MALLNLLPWERVSGYLGIGHGYLANMHRQLKHISPGCLLPAAWFMFCISAMARPGPALCQLGQSGINFTGYLWRIKWQLQIYGLLMARLVIEFFTPINAIKVVIVNCNEYEACGRVSFETLLLAIYRNVGCLLGPVGKNLLMVTNSLSIIN